MKKVLSFFLVITMVFTLSVNATAAEATPYNTTIIQENEAVRVAQSFDSIYIYTATYHKIDNTVQLVVKNKESGRVIESNVTQIHTLVNDTGNSSRAALEETTFTNYEYKKTYGNPNLWELRRPGDVALVTWVYFETYETSGNLGYLTTFKNAVDDINVKEGEIAGSLGMAALSYLAASAAGAGAIFTGGTMTAAAWAALLVAGGYSTAYIADVMAYDQSCKNAYDAYWEAYYHSTIL